jgi:hypothetical protein
MSITDNQDIFLIYKKRIEKIFSSKEIKSFQKSFDKVYQTAKNLPFDPRANAVHWAFDVQKLCFEIAYSLCWMNAYAEYYKSQIKKGSQPSSTNFNVSYYADNCITRIDSCVDKIALMIWAYYCPFNPEKQNEILDYKLILEKLERPGKFSLKIKNHNKFLKYLKLLKGDGFKRLETYRHLKIHRREPRIEIHGTEPHHDMSYLLPLWDEKSIKKWEEKLEIQYPDKLLRESVKKGCFINNTLYEQKKIKNRVWSFSEINLESTYCFNKLIESSTGCFRTLMSKSPFNKRRR